MQDLKLGSLRHQIASSVNVSVISIGLDNGLSPIQHQAIIKSHIFIFLFLFIYLNFISLPLFICIWYHLVECLYDLIH